MLNNLEPQGFVTETLVPWLTDQGLTIVVIIAGAFFIKWLTRKFIDRVVRRAVPGSGYLSKQAEEKRENTLIQLFTGLINVLVWIFAVLMILGEFGIDIGPLIAGAGIAGVALGFGAQYLVRDLISGFFIVFENQYRVGDVVCFGNTCGEVETITLRTTILRDLDGTVHYMPNGEIKQTSNMSKGFSRINLNVGISYATDVDEAAQIINRVGEIFAADEDWKDVVISPPKFLRIEDLGDSAVVIKVLGEVKPLQQWAATGELRKRIKKAFDEAGIDIPFPQQVVHHINE